MKNIITILIFTLLATSDGVAQEIHWVSMEEALELQKKSPKKIMMDVYTNWCGPCKLLDRNTFQNKDVASYVNTYYYAVKFNGEGNDSFTYKGNVFSNPNYNPEKASQRNSAHQFASYLRVNAYPTIIFFDEKGDLIVPLPGYRTPTQLELYLKMFKNDDHRSIDSQEKFNAYSENFIPEFKS